MPESASPFALEYAAPGRGPDRWVKGVLRFSAVAAGTLAVAPCFAFLLAAYALANGMVGEFNFELLVYFAWMARGPLLVWAAILAWRAANSADVPPRRLTLILLITFAIGVSLVLSRLAQNGIVGGSELFDASVEASSAIAHHLCLLMPLLLISRLRTERWQLSRATLLAVGVLLLGVPRGVSLIYWDAVTIAEQREIPFADAIRAAIQQPSPIVGLWPLLSLAAAIVLLASRGTGNRVAIRWAVFAGLVFNAVIAWNDFNWWSGVGGPFEVLLLTSTVLEAAEYMTGAALPLALLWWATRAPPVSTDERESALHRSTSHTESVA